MGACLCAEDWPRTAASRGLREEGAEKLADLAIPAAAQRLASGQRRAVGALLGKLTYTVSLIWA